MGRQKKFIPLLAFLLFPQEARGQEVEERQIKYKERTEIDFEGVDITGELVKPAGSLVMDRRKAQFNPLIRLRLDFDDKMKESIDEIK